LDGQKIYSVRDINRYIRDLIEQDFTLQDVWIRGEISNFTHHSRGHMYFTVKDEDAVLKAVMFAGSNRYLKFIPKNGTKVLVRGNITVYEAGGQYQLIAKEMQPDGIGGLYLAYEQLKEKLEKEGIFAPERKRTLPAYPRVIGVITSPTGAAVRDIVTTLRRRYPIVRIILIPVLVQGEGAPSAICKALEFVNRSDEVDVLIVGRGGGSIEELWAFNEESVARSIFSSKIPVISAVGHETDFTIADFVADIRAATPTAAAELAVPHLSDLQQKLNWLSEKLHRQLQHHYQTSLDQWRRVHKSLLFRHPKKQVEAANQSLDRLVEQLGQSIQRCLKTKKNEITQHTQRLYLQSPKQKLLLYQEQIARFKDTLQRQANTVTSQKRNEWMYAVARLDGLSPLKIMHRGYSLIYKEQALVKSINQLDPGDVIKVQLADGNLDCSVWGIEERKTHGEK
jgi:exodeoxyribonuclease VII large subunit